MQKKGKVSCLLIDSSARQKKEGKFLSQVLFLLNCNLLLYRWFYDRFVAGWLPIPSGNEDLLVKIAEKEMKLEQQAKRYYLKTSSCIFSLKRITKKLCK